MRIYCAVFEEARSSPCRGSGVPCCHDYTPLISIIYIHKIAQRCDIGVLSQHSAEGQATCKNSLRLPIGQAIPFVGGTPLEEKVLQQTWVCSTISRVWHATLVCSKRRLSIWILSSLRQHYTSLSPIFVCSK